MYLYIFICYTIHLFITHSINFPQLFINNNMLDFLGFTNGHLQSFHYVYMYIGNLEELIEVFF